MNDVAWFADRSHEPFHLAGDGPGALLLHGFMGTPKEMRPVAHSLAARGARVVAPLLAGFGPRINEIDHVTCEWISGARDSWEALSSDQGADILLGYSMGGSVALHLAVERPPRFLILIAPLWRVLGGDWRVRLLPVLKHVVRRVRPFARADLQDPEVRQFFNAALPELNLDDPDVQQRIRNDVVIPTATIDELRRLADSAGNQAARLQCETLVIQGRDDRSVRVEDTRELVERMPDRVRFVELPGDHALVSNESPSWNAVEQLILEFTRLGGER